ncbi:serine protease [Polyangium sorediatum]|uniref:Serine protease n=1 Tax=Polyangium sorediatum TaxID=889274 RepID=A0ABT6P1M0_9BACT|nr:serine protease [Polyangium sorediatum]MDI1434490.1 serine protease [Polyangium sorediatum]
MRWRDVYRFGLVSLALHGCGAGSETSPPPAAPKAPASASAQAASKGPAKAPDKLERDALKTVLPMGLPWLLRRVWPEEVFREGKFVGWRLVAIPEEWTGLDVRPDDVVTRVNGKTVETPEQLWDVWTSLATAPELRVTYERGAETKEIVLPIAGAPAPELLASLTNPSPPPRKATTKRGTIVIESRDPAGDDPDAK